MYALKIKITTSFNCHHVEIQWSENQLTWESEFNSVTSRRFLHMAKSRQKVAQSQDYAYFFLKITFFSEDHKTFVIWKTHIVLAHKVTHLAQPMLDTRRVEDASHMLKMNEKLFERVEWQNITRSRQFLYLNALDCVQRIVTRSRK